MSYILIALAGTIGLLWVGLKLALIGKRKAEEKRKDAEVDGAYAQMQIARAQREDELLRGIKEKALAKDREAQARIEAGFREDFEKDSF